MSCHPGSWIGVDLDGTLAHYDGWKGVTHVGKPIRKMVKRVQAWLVQGYEVRIVTARVGPGQTEADVMAGATAIHAWCLKHIGQHLTITATKDLKMYELWDDRAVCVEKNTGRVLGRNEEENLLR